MLSIKTLRHTFRTWTFLLYEDRHIIAPFHLDPGSSWSLSAVSTSGALSPLCSTSPLVEGLMFPNILYLRFTISTKGHLAAIVVRKPCHVRGLHCSYSSEYSIQRIFCFHKFSVYISTIHGSLHLCFTKGM
jgi:hypothetical protein